MQDSHYANIMAKLGELDAKVEMLTGNGQPGRMTLAENRITALEASDIRRTWTERILNGALALLVSAVIALHDHWWPK